MHAMEEKLNQVKVRVLMFFIFEENQNFVFCGQSKQNTGLGFKSCSEYSKSTMEGTTRLQTADPGPEHNPASAHLAHLLSWTCSQLAPVFLEVALPWGPSRANDQFPFQLHESPGAGFETRVGLAISGSCLSSWGSTFEKAEP